MKTERVTLLTTPEFKAFLGTEAAREGVSVAELVRGRCEQRAGADEALLASLAAELRQAVREAQASLSGGLADANAALAELRARRQQAPAAAAAATAKASRKTRKTAKTAKTPIVRKPAAGAHA